MLQILWISPFLGSQRLKKGNLLTSLSSKEVSRNSCSFVKTRYQIPKEPIKTSCAKNVWVTILVVTGILYFQISYKNEF